MLEELFKIIQQQETEIEPNTSKYEEIDNLLSILKAALFDEKLSSQLTESQIDSIRYDLVQINELLNLNRIQIATEALIAGSTINVLFNDVVKVKLGETNQNQQSGGGGEISGMLSGLFGGKSFGPALPDTDDIKKPKLK
jgi:hypothetical protein